MDNGRAFDLFPAEGNLIDLASRVIHRDSDAAFVLNCHAVIAKPRLDSLLHAGFPATAARPSDSVWSPELGRGGYVERLSNLR